ncbi:polysaccharide biosynthesis protein [Sphingomonas cannabina]|uniref:lipopolysaccharide biosynthesis protein n=1 Tax=Sphingomonas cannabina TaxID=2899123 RepID=UPI001F3BBD9E|nr:polysaccharide biosynthesis protein [Sphingomonas cannabina]UIJ46166.1 polysaccharide biosynthesis protein [Sphingomonas cannabina]
MAEAQAIASPPTKTPLRATLARFGLASMSSAFVSASHLLVQLVSVRRLSATEVGTLAFLLVIIQLGYGLSNALVSTPYAIAVNQRSEEEGDHGFFFPLNLLLSLAQGLICAGIGWVMAGPLAAAAFGAAGVVSLLRWFGRATSYAHHRPATAAFSDFVYAGLVTAGVAGTLAFGPRLELFGAVLATAGLVGLAPFGLRFLARHRPLGLVRAFGDYREVWKRQSAWTLIGVITTEATSNAHSYAVTALAGPAAFAPIAVGALFFRPVNVCITALTQLERPRMARAVAHGDERAARRSSQAFTAALALVWLATSITAAVILWFFPHILIRPTLSVTTVTIAAALSSLLTLVQCLQSPMSVLTQARGAFRPLAATSVRSCLVGIAAVLALTFTVPPVYTVAGVVLSQLVMMLGILRLERRLRPAAAEAAR